MAGRFNPRRIAFGKADDEDTGDGLPAPHKVKLRARRATGIAEAKDTLANLPGPGESLHALCTSRMDMADVVSRLLEHHGRCEAVRIATLGYNARNLASMLDWLDSGSVGRLTLLASVFFRSHKGADWQRTLEEFRKRNQRAACCHSHAKVITIAFPGLKYSLEGSANLCGNGSAREQFALINDPGIHDWHAQWIESLVDKHEGDENTNGAAG